MKWLGYPIYRLLFCYIAGVVAGYYLEVDLGLVQVMILASFVMIAISVFLFPKLQAVKWVFGLSTMLFFTSLGIGMLHFKDASQQPHHFQNQLVSSDEQLVHLKLYKRLSSNQYNDRFYAQVLQVEDQIASGNVLVLFKRSDSISYQIGDRLLVYDDISEASNERNPGDFNYKQYLELIDVQGQMYLDKNQIFQVISAKNDDQIASMRVHLMGLLDQSDLEQKPRAMIQALILGQRENLDLETSQNFRDAGVIHILALSGLHVGIILLILRFCTQWMHRIRHGRWIQSAIIIILLWCYALLTGMSPSILRAVTMFSFIAIGMNIRRKSSVYHSLAVSAFILLLINPKLLFQVGFQLSYTAVFFIVLLQPVLYRLWNVDHPIFKFFWRIASVTIAAQIGVAPLSLFYFHQFPGLFLAGNLLLLPMLPLIIGASLLLVILLLLQINAYYLAVTLNTLLTWIIEVVEYISSFDQFIIKNVYFSIVELCLIYAVIISLAWFFNTRTRRSRKERVIRSKAGWQFHLALGFVAIFFLVKIYDSVKPNPTEYVLLHQAVGSAISVSNNVDATLMYDFHVMDSLRQANALSRLQATRLLRNKKTNLDTLKNYVPIINKRVLIVDEDAVYPKEEVDVVILSQSPKVHLERLIKQLKPQTIIADGSNYRSSLPRWKATCNAMNVRFLNTYETGAIDLINLEAYIQN